MSCQFDSFGNVQIVTCGIKREPCGPCGSTSTCSCSAELRGRLAGQRCNRKLCNRCAERSGGEALCPAHARIAKGR